MADFLRLAFEALKNWYAEILLFFLFFNALGHTFI